jgi:hypothetical protein
MDLLERGMRRRVFNRLDVKTSYKRTHELCIGVDYKAGAILSKTSIAFAIVKTS